MCSAKENEKIIHRLMADELIKLQAWYAWKSHTQNHLDYEKDILGRRVNFYFFKDFSHNFSEKNYSKIISEIENLFKIHGKNEETADLETAVLKKVRDSIVTDEYLDNIYEKFFVEAIRKAIKYHGFYYDVNDKEKYIELHFRNVFTPESPFSHKDELKAGLEKIAKEVCEQMPPEIKIYCGTWLNSVKSFSSLFPETWLASAMELKPAAHLGWWGQFIDKTGNFNQRNALQFRETGMFPFGSLRCNCTLKEIVQKSNTEAP